MNAGIKPDSENEIFRLAEEYVNHTSKHVFLTGKAGTGKTTFLKHIRETSPKNILVAAPTGVAAINAGGMTLHSLFQLSFEPFIPGSKLKNVTRFTRQKRDLLRKADVLIIDEASMLRADVSDAIDATLKFARQNTRPFGGIQMLLIGDMFQLPPVVKDNEQALLKDFYKSPFFFHSKAFERIPLVYLELKKIYRQRDREFIDLLNAVRNDRLTKNDLDKLNSRYIPDFDSGDKKYITLCTHNYLADEINASKLARLPGAVRIVKGEITGDFPETSLPTDLNLQLKPGAQIIFIKNDMQNPRRYYNGKIGEVTGITDSNEIYVRPEGSVDELKVERETWRNHRYKLSDDRTEILEEELGTFSQYPLRTAWAITVHKSQGLTFENAIIDAGKAFAPGQVYVALSRCTSPEGIVLKSPISPSAVRADFNASEFSKNERSAYELRQLLEKSKREFEIERFVANFDFTDLRRIMYDYKSATANKVSDELTQAHESAEELYSESLKIDSVAKRLIERLESPAMKHDAETMKKRAAAGAGYFYEQIRTKIILPLQAHKSQFAGITKAKAYWRMLNETEKDLIRFVKRFSELKFGDDPVVENIKFEPIAVDKSVKSSEKKNKNPSEKKIGSKRISYDMFRSGKTAKQIAEERNITINTVETHLLGFVKSGDLAASELIAREKIDVIRSAIEETMRQNGKSDLKSLKNMLGEGYEYNEIKAVLFETAIDIR